MLGDISDDFFAAKKKYQIEDFPDIQFVEKALVSCGLSLCAGQLTQLDSAGHIL